MTGIYLITNIETNKQYVGKSKDIERRWKQHMNNLNCNEHHNKELQEDWIKYGQDKFTFKILESCSEKLLSNREKHWIDIFNAREYGYNYDSRNNTKSTYNNKNSINHKKFIQEIFDICKHYYSKDQLGLIYLEDLCEFLNIDKNKLLSNIYKLNKKDFNCYNIFIQHNWDSSCEYISFSSFDEEEIFEKEIYVDYKDLKKLSMNK